MLILNILNYEFMKILSDNTFLWIFLTTSGNLYNCVQNINLMLELQYFKEYKFIVQLKLYNSLFLIKQKDYFINQA